MQVAHRPSDPAPDGRTRLSPALQHPLFAWLGVRPLASQHTEAEDVLLRKYARLAPETLVEIGVAEGGCRRDWQEWHGLVRPGGYVIFHDARLFAGGWTHPQVGSVRVVEALFYGPAALPDWQIVDGADSMLVVQKVRS